ncbi:MAG: hypothetical protein ACRC6A_06115 [Fusobacteriaceae bacterium]
MKWKFILFFIFVLSILGINNKYLNEVSKKEKILQKKEKDLQETQKKYDNKIIEYDNAIDFEKIRKELELKGFKTTRYIEYLQMETGNKE